MSDGAIATSTNDANRRDAHAFILRTVADDRAVRLHRFEREVDGLAERRGLGRLDRDIAIGRGEARRLEERVPLAEREIERGAKEERHRAARGGAAVLEIAEMARRDLGVLGEARLAHATKAAMTAKKAAERRLGAESGRHGESLTRENGWRHDLGGHGPDDVRRQSGAMKKLLPAIVLVPFTVFSLLVIVQHGYFGFVSLAAQEPWALQMLLDVSIALFLVGGGIRRDARSRGLPSLPYVLALPFVGSIGALAYLVHRSFSDGASRREGPGRRRG